MPVKTMLLLLHALMTVSPRMELPGSAMYFTPDLAARLMLSEKGKNVCAARDDDLFQNRIS